MPRSPFCSVPGYARLSSCLLAALLCACQAALPHRIESASRPRAAVAAPATVTTAAPMPPPAPAAPAAVAAAPRPPAPTLPANMPLPRLPAYARADADPTAAEAAQNELRRAKDRTGLSDAQLARLQGAQDQIAAGDNASALTQLQLLNAELAAETRRYTVQEGESLWHIAAHDEVYGNPYLWPLLWYANQDRVHKPYQVYKGLRLTVPVHPSVEEVSAALDYGKAHASEAKTAAKAPADTAAPPAAAPTPKP